MIIDRVITRNSGATLEPCIYKHGHGVREQGMKMGYYPRIFAPVHLTEDGYFMPKLDQPDAASLPQALARLADLWLTPSLDVTPVDTTDRARHHAVQVAPLVFTDTINEKVLEKWRVRTANIVGTPVAVVHGDPTLENYMMNGVWLDPSIRPLPLEAEVDGGKLLQSYFGYSFGTGVLWWEQKHIRNFLHEQRLSIELCAYYLVTHIIRLYRVQPQARSWALDVLTTLDARMEELTCK